MKTTNNNYVMLIAHIYDIQIQQTILIEKLFY